MTEPISPEELDDFAELSDDPEAGPASDPDG